METPQRRTAFGLWLVGLSIAVMPALGQEPAVSGPVITADDESAVPSFLDDPEIELFSSDWTPVLDPQVVPASGSSAESRAALPVLPDRSRLLPRTTTVAAGQAMIEGGLFYRDFGDSELTETFDAFDQGGRFRYGLTDDIEFRIGANARQVGFASEDFLGDLFDTEFDYVSVVAGTKAQLLEPGPGGGWMPNTSILLEGGYSREELTISGPNFGYSRGSFEQSGFRLLGLLLLDWRPVETTTFGLNIGFAHDEADLSLVDEQTYVVGSLFLEHRFDQFTLFGEVGATDSISADAIVGIVVPVRDRLFLDFHIGIADYYEEVEADYGEIVEVEMTGPRLGGGVAYTW